MNPYAKFVVDEEQGNPYAAFVHSPTVNEEEQDVIRRVNDSTVESPRNFGFVEFPATIANEFNRSLLTIPKEVGVTVLEAGELAETMEGDTLDIAMDSFTARMIKNIEEGDTGIKGLLQTIWGTEKDVILSALPEEAAPALMGAGKSIIEQNDAATNFLLGAPKSGFAADVGSGFGSLLKSIGAWYIGKDPKAAGAYMTMSINSGDYMEARQAGKDPEEAAAAAFSSAAIQGKIEKVGMGIFTAALASSSFFKKVLFRSAQQTVEETAQATVEETVKDVAGVRDTDFETKLHNILYQGALGFIVGAPTSVVFTKMENTAKGYGIDPAEIKKQLDAFVNNKEQVIDGAAEILNREATGITKDAPARAEALKAMQDVLSKQQKIETAMEEGTTDPTLAAEVILRSDRYSDDSKAAVRDLPDGFTMEDLQRVAQPIPDMTVEASSAQSLKQEVTQESIDAQMNIIKQKEGLEALSVALIDNKDAELINIQVSPSEFNQGKGTRAMQELIKYADENGLRLVLDPATRGDPNSKGTKSRQALVDFYKRFGFVENRGANFRKSVPFSMYRKPQPISAAVMKNQQEGMASDESKRGIYQQVLTAAKRKQTIGEKALDLGGDIKRMTGNALTPISTRLKNINPKLKAKLREFEFKLSGAINKDQAVLTPFLEKFTKLSPEDFTIMDFAMKNGDMDMVNEIAKANNMQAEVKAIRKMLEGIYDRAQSIGLDIGYKENYFPRMVEKPEKVIAYFRGTEEWGQISEALREKERELGAPLDDEAKAELINTLLRGYGKSQITLAKPGNLKERKLDVINPELNQYYATTDQALLRYVVAINNNIETRRFLGRGSKTAGLYDNINDSIGWFVMHEMASGNIRPSQEAELTEILQARFKPGRMGAFWRTYKNVEYISTMGSTVSAITQMGDQAFAMYKNGVYRTLKALPRAIAGKSQITREDINIEQIAQEFSEQSTTGNALRAIFKVTGFDKMDRLGKETLINGAFDRYRSQAKKPTQAFTESLEVIFGDQTDQVIADLKEGKVTENVKLLLFNELLDVQPVALSEMPVSYLKMGNGKVLYMLKTFTIKQFDVYRAEVFSQLRTNPVQGIKNLTRLLAFFVMMNAGADWLKDLLLGRETPVEEHVANNILRVAGVSKFQVYTARREGLGSAAGKTILPPFSVIDGGYKDMAKLIEDGELDPEDMKSVQSVPIAGKFYYWWMGAGSD